MRLLSRAGRESRKTEGEGEENVRSTAETDGRHGAHLEVANIVSTTFIQLPAESLGENLIFLC
jgi:hypothetical protein